MREVKRLPKLSEMEHITSKEFGENMDAILDRVSQEEIALIIDHQNQSYVLCPAHWFELPEINHIETMIKNAVRYVAAVDEVDINETLEFVKTFLPALSSDCIATLHGIVKNRKQGNANKAWAEMERALEDALAPEKQNE